MNNALGRSLIALLIAVLVTPAPAQAGVQGSLFLKTAEQSVLRESREGRVLLVGPTRKLNKPSAAARIAKPGDLIKIDAGDYVDCAIWRTPNIRIRGVGGYAHVKNVSCAHKAIWVFYASPVHISHVRLSGSRVPHNNGAGIRWEGYGRLVLENSWIHNNQMGILSHNKIQSAIIISNSRFEHNGDCPTFCGHGVYAGRIAHLSITNSHFTGHKHGHHIKSRAYNTEIAGNRITDGSTGTSSYAINLPDSGTASIRNNFIQKGPKTENAKAIIAIGEEGPWNEGGHVNPSRGIVITGNVFQNNAHRQTNFVWNRGFDPVTLRGNQFTGPGVRYRGYGQN